MKPSDMNKCDLFLEYQDLCEIDFKCELAIDFMADINHSLFDKQINKAVAAIRELSSAVRARQRLLSSGSAGINSIYEKWSNDELA